MKKSIRALIISLSTILVLSAATAITVPILIHQRDVKNENSIRDITIKEAVINTKSDSLAREILDAESEQEMREKVEEFNKNDKWDDVFIFTNENDKFVTDVVDYVVFDLKINQKLAVFSIKYDDDYKITNGADVVEAKVGLDTILYISGDATAAATTFLTNQLSGHSFYQQKETYDNLTGRASNQFVNEISNIIKFNNGEVDWSDAVDNVTLTTGIFPSNPKEDIPQVEIKINLKAGYKADNIDMLTFNSNSLGKSANNKIDQSSVDNAKEAAKNVLIDELNGKNFYEQRDLYNNYWKNGITPAKLLDEIKKEIKFGTEDIVTNATIIADEDFPLTPGNNIPSVKIDIELKDGHTNNNGNSSFIINIDDLGQVGTITIDRNDDEVITDVENLLKPLLTVGNPNDQKSKYESFVTDQTIHSQIINAINNKTTPNDVIADIILIHNGPFDTTLNAIIPGVTITFMLKPGYVTLDGNNSFTISTGDLGNVNTTISFNNNNVKTTIENILKTSLTIDNAADQKTKYEGLVNDVAIHSEIINAIKTLTTPNDVVDNINVNLNGPFDTTFNADIPSVTVTVNLKTGYVITGGDMSFEITTDNLGKVAKSIITDNNISKARTDITNKLTKSLRDLDDYVSKEIMYESWRTPLILTNELKDTIENAIGFIGSVESVIRKDGNIFPGINSSSQIPGIEIEVVLKPGYEYNGSNSFNIISDTLGMVGVVINDSDINKAKTPVTDELSRLLAQESSYNDQNTLFESWKTNGLTNELKTIIENAIGFPGSVKTVVIVGNPSFPNLGSVIDIPAIQIIIGLEDGYKYNNNLPFFPIDTDTLGPLGTTQITNIDAAKIPVTNQMTSVLEGFGQLADGYNKQKDWYEKWINNTDFPSFETAIANAIGFSGSVKSVIAVEGGIFPTKPSSADTVKIPPIKIRVQLKDGYRYGSNDWFEIWTDELGYVSII